MELKIGAKIKELRMAKGMTQEELAAKLGVSFQVVSKWETNVSIPDVALLPEISFFFGITLDELFSLNRDDHIIRIEAMIRDERQISNDNFTWAERYLKGLLSDNPCDQRIRILLVELYDHRRNNDSLTAAHLCEVGIKSDPANKALNGELYRIRVSRQEEDRLIRFYEPLLSSDAQNTVIAGYLIRLYIKCRQFDRAQKLLDELYRTSGQAIYPIYAGDIALARDREEQARSIWISQTKVEGIDHISLFELGERLDRIDEYELAVECYTRSYEMQRSPRELDALYSLAFMYIKRNRKQEAIRAWEQILHDLTEEYHIDCGETVDWAKREIDKLKK